MSGVDALDIDSTKHSEAGDWLQRWEPIDTRTHRTRSGGSHFLFQHEPGLSSQQSYPVAGVDIRADGGYIIWWPAAGFGVRDRPIIEWPAAILAEVRRPTALPGRCVQPQVTGSAYAAHAIASACRAILEATNGLQQATLNREAFSLGTLVGAGRAREDVVRRALRETARRMHSYDERRPWRDYQIDKIVDDAVTAGMRRPRGEAP
jgi:hypothetical protein